MPGRRQPVSPALNVPRRCAIVRYGCLSVPGFELLPLTDAYLVQAVGLAAERSLLPAANTATTATAITAPTHFSGRVLCGPRSPAVTPRRRRTLRNKAAEPYTVSTTKSE